MRLDEKTLPRIIDITVVRTHFTIEDVKRIAEVCKKHKFVCTYALNSQMPLLKELLKDEKEVHVGYSVGFPSGGETTDDKLFQVKEGLRYGADEMDAVINVGRLKSKDYDYVQRDVDEIVKAASPVLVKIIIETMLLNEDEIRKAAEIVMNAGAWYIKTGTGWISKPTTPEHVSIIKETVKDNVLIKASGGIRGLSMITDMYKRGANRFGMSCEYALNVLNEIKKHPGGIEV